MAKSIHKVASIGGKARDLMLEVYDLATQASYSDSDAKSIAVRLAEMIRQSGWSSIYGVYSRDGEEPWLYKRIRAKDLKVRKDNSATFDRLVANKRSTKEQ